MQVQSYLFFDGRAEEAIEFYKKAVGAKVDALMRFKESPDPSHNPPGSAEKIMHAAFRVGDTQIMASDGNCAGKTAFQGFGLALSVKSEAEADRTFAALADGGQVQMPLGKTFFSPKFGMVADRFGVTWMIMVAH
jgi:PhnB protein